MALKQYKIPLVKDTISQADIDALANWLKKNPRLTKGELTKKFEAEWSKWNGSKYSVFVNSGSSANLLMVYALFVSGRLKNDIAVVPAVSWATTVSPFMQYGIEPILCDCDPDDLGLDVEHFEQICKENRPAIAIIVHVLGHANKMKEILRICKKYDVILLEDCCEAHGAEYNGIKVGNFGLAGSFSFYYGHHMSTIEGGMIVTNDEEIYNIALSLRSHGWARDLDDKWAARFKNKYQINDFRNLYSFYYPGFNLRPTDLNAFLGLRQLKRLNQTVKKREKNYLRYKKALEPYYWVQKSQSNLVSSFAFGLQTPHLDELVQALSQASIETRPLVCGSIGEQPFWIKQFGKQTLPHASRIHHQGLYFSTNQDLTNNEVDLVCKTLTDFAEQKRQQSLKDLSVVICSKNSEAMIEKSIQSILEAAPEAELVVIDADSTDRTLEIARKYTKRIYSDRKKGLSYARQLGIQRSSHPYVAFVGADDTISRQTLEDLLVAIKRDKKIAGTQAKTVIQNPQSYWEKATQQIFDILLNQVGWVEVIGTPCIFRKDVLKKIRYDANITGGTDDTDVCLRLRRRGYLLEKVDTVSYEHQELDFTAFSKRWQFYGKGDSQFYDKYQHQWTVARKIQSLFHPFRKYMLFGSLTFLREGQLQFIPALYVAALSRYYGWFRHSLKSL